MTELNEKEWETGGIKVETPPASETPLDAGETAGQRASEEKKPKVKPAEMKKEKLRAGSVIAWMVLGLGVSASVAALFLAQLDTSRRTEDIAFDESGRRDRYAYFITDDGVNNTDAERWHSGQWTGYSAEDLLVNLSPRGTYTEPMAFLDYCGPKCFFDPAWVPEEGKPVIAEMLGITTQEYDYYSSHLAEWDSVKTPLIEHLEEKFPNSLWLAEMFTLNPTDLKAKQPSDFENWYKKWHETEPQSFNPDIKSTRERIQAVGFKQWKNAFAGRRNFSGAAVKGGGFGTSKGFS